MGMAIIARGFAATAIFGLFCCRFSQYGVG